MALERRGSAPDIVKTPLTGRLLGETAIGKSGSLFCLSGEARRQQQQQQRRRRNVSSSDVLSNIFFT